MDTVQKTIVWGNHLVLGLPILDKQHEHIVNAINDLNSACMESDKTANEHFKNAAGIVVAHIHHHFNTEEKLMDVLRFQDSINHKREHDDFLSELIEQSKMHKLGKRASQQTFVRFLADWFLSHIAVSDRVFADYILDMKTNDQIRQTLKANQENIRIPA